jgi:hypothetical protein
MKHFRKFRDPRFALTTLQNPLCEVRTRAELIQAAQLALQHQPDVAENRSAPAPAAPHQQPVTFNQPADLIAEPPKLHTTRIIVPVRKAAGKRAKSSPPQQAARGPIRERLPKAERGQLAEVVPVGGAAEYASEIFDRHITKSVAPHRDDDSDLKALQRHTRKCAICNHPDRADLEEDFVSWRNADLIHKDYDLPNFRTIYTHARATGLYQRRRENLRFAAELLIEHADQAKPSPDTILRAIQICARLNAKGDWVEPPKHVIFSSSVNTAAPAPEPQEPAREEESPNPQLSTPISSLTDTISINTQTLIDSRGD